ncbi:MAG TPA: hypothetical protein VEU52_04245 [Candidatus Limnocylindrales bacterium]|nr:hypothetical protein [Candidatus Limnocylindrales bacterium]
MKKAAVGFRVHSGWAAMVAVSLEKGAPAVLVRERVHLVKTFTYESRQPYHTAAKLEPKEARAFVAHIRKEARGLALRAIRGLREKLEEHGYALGRSAILMASGRPLPPLPKILEAHSLIHTADGELFREALIHASKRCGLENSTAKERDLPDAASRALRKKPTHLSRRITELGRGLGPPWSQDEKMAALAAWYALAANSPS